MRWLSVLCATILLSIHPAWGQTSRQPGWAVESRAGCWLWHPDLQPDHVVSWTGRCDDNGRATGTGIVEWRLGGKLDRGEVEYRDGKKNGRGVYTFWNGNRYEGEFEDDTFHGRGVLTFAGGGRYEGLWRGGQANGHGVYVRVDGNRYVGEWRDGCFQDPERPVAVGKPLSACP